ncbi:MAG TPA: 7-carboxy-7-deazaguanine synthase QueE [Acidimicrobiales bacterium]|nr:7-carboxy-7-deazaguanine synthase QueE [Acidimicrobiales bacterium]
MELAISEVFGPTFQGEGASLGRLCAFVRLARCNLTCGGPGAAKWACDTPYTWDWAGQNGTVYEPEREVHKADVADIVQQVLALGVDLVVVSGGEPLLQQRALAELAVYLRDGGAEVEVETNGTVVPSVQVAGLVNRFNVSPKLANSGVDRKQRYRPGAISALAATGKAVWKFVCVDEDDLDEVQRDFGHLSPIYVMPAGTSPGSIVAVSRRLAAPVIERGWSLTTRLHVLVWGDERGR